MRSSHLLALLLLEGGLSACQVKHDAYPSLAPRPIEKRGVPTVDGGGAVAPLPLSALDPASRARVDAAESQSSAADRDFTDALPAARAAVSRAGTPDSEGWVAAQQALSALEADRARGRAGLADVDALARELLDSGDPAKIGLAPAVSAAAARIQARNDAESAALEALERRLPSS